ncbi:M23 family metallopeptidase [Azospirillum halopraeferens]|uniref:M23 family metallopeptidase n=1 Tax=Azospirillum halopraeferens TaxID=34010 RepID=UPI0003F4EBF7|nr:peptidoglycan DD-metalloendopeptidase family protein [Azospirillum halopraeferens]
MRLRDVCLPALALCAAGAAGFLVPAAFPSASAADRSAAPPAFILPPVKPEIPGSSADGPAAVGGGEEAAAGGEEIAAEVVPAAAVPDGDDTPVTPAVLVTADPPAATVSGEDADSDAESNLDRRVFLVSRGDTLLNLLVGASVPRTEAAGAIRALREVYDPRSLQVGQQVTVLFEPRRGGARQFVGLELEPDVVRSVTVARTGDSGFESAEVERAVERRRVGAAAEVRSSLFEAGSAAGVPVSVMMAVIRLYSHEIDFQRDLQPGDRFEVLFERMVTDDGRVAGDGDVLYASLVLSGKERPMYRFKTRDGRVDYYDRDGASIRRALLRTPIDGARITSGFGMRRHPILGFSKMHQGMDFGAPTGTPIYAAGNGVVEEVGVKGAYGNYIRIRHNSEMATAYAHLSRFAGNVRRGGRVQQGEVIGYVGSTGRSTGPHLHYEVLRHNRQVNPASVDLPTGEKLDGRDLRDFLQTAKALDRAFEESKQGLQLARTPAVEDKGCTNETAC